MKKSLLYLLGTTIVVTALFMWGSGVVAGPLGGIYDNVTYTLPYLNTGAASNVYCVISNTTTDNATIQFRVVANSQLNVTSTSALENLMVGTDASKVYSGQTRMMSFEGLLINVDGVAAGSLAAIMLTNNSYGGRISLLKQNPGATQGQLPGGGPMNHSVASNGDVATPVVMGTWSCADLPMACFQGTTTPKRNLVGYICSDLYTPATPAQHFTY